VAPIANQQEDKKMWELIDEFEKDGFLIRTAADGETENPSDHFDDAETIRAICTGELEWFIVKVEALKAGIVLGTAYLGACCYKDCKDFINHDGDYHADMIAEAIDEAKAKIKELIAV
jgi:hypothetical protein